MDDTRRRHLLAIANLEKYAVETFSDIYYSLTTSKRDNGKIKTDCIYGNGVVENQLANPTPPTQTISDVVFTNNGDGSYTVNGTASATATKSVSATFQVISGHYYLICGCASGGSNSTYRLLEGYTYRWNDTNGSGYIQVANNSGNAGLLIEVKSGTVCNNLVFRPQFVDLTLMFGTGNEPTSLTDHRIQALLNRGYIPYNAGTYKGTDIGLFSSEPYNLFDGEIEGNGIDTYTGLNISSGNNFRCVNYISVIGGREYMIELNGTALGTTGYNFYLIEYDANKDFLKTTDGWQITSKTYTLLSNTKFVRFQVWKSGSNWATNVPTNTNICFHRTGTRTGYAPHPEWLELNHFVPNTAGSVSDNYKDFVFSRNVGFYTFTGNENGGVQNTDSQGIVACLINIFNNTAKVGGEINLDGCDQAPYQSYTYSHENTCFISTATYLCINLGKTTFEATKNALIGKTIYFELATPQTITMANNCLQCVDLGSLSWEKATVYSRTMFRALINPIRAKTGNDSVVGNIYCSEYLSTNYNSLGSGDKLISLRGIAYEGVVIYDSSKTGLTSDAFKESVAGQYLFYETASPINEIASGVFTQKNVIYTPSAIQLDGALNAKNKLQITPQNYVITRNVSLLINMGDLTWQQANTSGTPYNIRWRAYFTSFATSDWTKDDVLCEKYQTVDFAGATALMSGTRDKVCALSDNARIDIVDSSYDSYTADQVKSALNGYRFVVSLATPQTTTIARRHLKAVDLSTLDFAYNSTDKAFYVQLTDMVNSTYYSKVFTPNYLGEIITTLSGMGDRHIAISNRWLYIKDLRYNTATAFKTAVAGQYLWYETTNEVDDMVNKALFENGGCIRACEFGWVENQIINDGNFPSTTNWKTNSVTLSASDNTLTITSSQSNPGWGTYQNGLSIVSTHKYALMMSTNLNSGLTEIYGSCGGGDNETYGTPTQNTWTKVCHIFSNIGSGNAITIYVRTGTGSIGDTLKLKEVKLIDLTLAFGSGNEPTSINDPRIQYILNKGYIPTNTTGTYKYIDTEVLPSADMKVQQ